MFRNRKTDRKPPSELYSNFKKSFPHVGPGTVPASAASSDSTISIVAPSTAQAMDQRPFGDQDSRKDQDTNLEDPEHWRFTPSMLDTNSFSFASFANQHSGGYTPTPGGTNPLFHNQAGDLHTPSMGFQLGTPLSSNASHPASAIDMHGFHAHLLHSQQYQNASAFQEQQSYAPSSFIHQDSGYDTNTLEQNSSRLPDPKSDVQSGSDPNQDFARQHPLGLGHLQGRSIPSTEKFRYHVTLNAPTAMIKHADEIPITYLNKGQAYAVSISDSMCMGPQIGPTRYRTVIRISFEDEQQRQCPSACWQLWKEGRGLAEAHQRGGKLQAVEYVDPNQGGDAETKKPRVELEMASFDCFSVTWSPDPASATADCSVAVRFNFLSTDFSHSKGVKGIPVRLCAKTEIVSSGTPESPAGPKSEVCFCKVKLFRDHGAERKLSNDIAHIKKTIDKLKQQITHVENGVKDVGKRKRSGSVAVKGSHHPIHRAGKVQKHKRTWSVSSQDSSGRPAIEDDLHMNLATMQDMFSSTRPVSLLYLKGYEQDDPDRFPVALLGERPDLMNTTTFNQDSWKRKQSGEITPTNSIMSTSTSSRSVPSGLKAQEQSIFRKKSGLDSSQQVHNDWEQLTHFSNPDFSSAFPDAVKVAKPSQADSSLPDWIDAFGYDPLYKAPPERPIKPIACFYVLIKIPGEVPENDYYKAVYLMERTLQDLITSIATKCGVEPLQITRTIQINSKGLKIMVDDEVVREMPEGQDMIVDFHEGDTSQGLKDEAGSCVSTPKADSSPIFQSKKLEMRLVF